MAITNGYATLAEFKAYKNGISSTDATDDGVIEDLIEAASRYIDNKTGRTFYARSETHYFDAVGGRELYMDDDLLTITTLTNGDSNAIASTEYILLPYNKAPYFAIELKGSSTYVWETDSSGNYRKVISVVGTWGYATSAPDDIKIACLEIASLAYGRRSGENTGGVAAVTGAGVVITPQDINSFAAKIIAEYQRLGISFGGSF